MKPEFYSVPKRRLTPFYVMGILFVVTVVLPLLIFFNLKKYAVYYAGHTPHADNINPAAVELVENMYFNYNPRDNLYFKWKNGIIYSIDSAGKMSYPLFRNSSIGNDYNYFVFQINDDMYYVLDRDLTVIGGQDTHDFSRITYLSESQKIKVQERVLQFIGPIIEAQPKPFLFNFQWLYDLLNHTKFN